MNTINLVTNINQLMNRGETVIKKLRDTGVQEINAKSLKGVSGFNKGDMAPLLVEFYEITKRAMEIIPALQALEKQAITKLDKLEDKVFADGLPEALNLANVRRVIKEELKEAVPSITKDAKEETEKKWSDLFTKNQQKTPSNGFNSAHIEGKKLAREIIAEEDRQRNVIIRGYTLEGLAADDDDNVGSENRSYSHAPISVDYLITNGLKEPSLTDSVQRVTLVGKPYFPPDSKYDTKVIPNEDGEDHRLQTVKVTFTTKESAREFLRLRFNLQHGKWSKLYLSPDRSPSDRKRLKELVEEKRKKIAEFPEKTLRITKFLKLESFLNRK